MFTERTPLSLPVYEIPKIAGLRKYAGIREINLNWGVVYTLVPENAQILTLFLI